MRFTTCPICANSYKTHNIKNHYKKCYHIYKSYDKLQYNIYKYYEFIHMIDEELNIPINLIINYHNSIYLYSLYISACVRGYVSVCM